MTRSPKKDVRAKKSRRVPQKNLRRPHSQTFIGGPARSRQTSPITSTARLQQTQCANASSKCIHDMNMNDITAVCDA